MKRNVKILIDDIIECIEKIEKYTRSKTKERFLKDTEVQDAVMRRLEIIGEASKNIPVNFRAKHLDIPWKKIAGMRDILTHEYFDIRLERVWRTVKKDLPDLKKKVLHILKELN